MVDKHVGCLFAMQSLCSDCLSFMLYVIISTSFFVFIHFELYSILFVNGKWNWKYIRCNVVLAFSLVELLISQTYDCGYVDHLDDAILNSKWSVHWICICLHISTCIQKIERSSHNLIDG